MNGRFRKASALIATAALVSGGLIAVLTTPAGATATTGCQAGCVTAGAGGEVAYNNGPFNIGVNFSVADAGQLNTICYQTPDGDLTDQVFLSGPYSTSGTASNGCLTLNHAIPAGSYTAYYTSGTNYYQGTENGAPVTTGDLTIPANGGVYSSSGVPTTTGYGDTVTLVFYSNPNPPTVTVTATSTTSANLAVVGDSEGGAASIFVACSQVGGPTNSGTIGTGSTPTLPQSGLATNGQPEICTAQETSNVGLHSAVGTAQAYLPPPAPINVGVVQKDLTSVSVSFTGQGTNIGHYTATCTSSAGGSHSATGTTSPIVVTGFTNTTSQTITCSVTETFAAPNSLTGAPSGNGATVMFGSSGPGCTPSGKVAAPDKVSAAAEAFPGAQVSWAPVTTDCLVGYLITPSTGSAFLSLGQGTTTLMKGPFAFGSSVTFTVSAVTGSGAGPASTGVSVTIGTPAAVTSVHVAHVAKGVVKVAFKAGANNGAAIKRFTATCGSKSASGTSSPLIVKGLKPGGTYTCTVVATNSRGTGAAARSAAVKA